MPRRIGVRPFFILTAILTASTVAFAAQFLVFDTLVTHRGVLDKEPYGHWESHINLKYAPGIPTNWKSPIDYYNGTAYWRFEIHSKPTNYATHYQVCLNREKTEGGYWHLCTKCTKFSSQGQVLRGQERVSKIWYHVEPKWTAFSGYPQLVMKDGTSPCTIPIATSWKGWKGFPDLKNFYPVKVNYAMYVVSKGAQFKPPSWWNSPSFRPDSSDSSSQDTTSNDTISDTGGVEIRVPFRSQTHWGDGIATHDNGTLLIQSTQANLVRVRIFNLRGALMASVFKGKGMREHSLPTHGWASGIHVVCLETKKGERFFKVPVLP